MQTLVAEILTAWRRAERLSATFEAGTVEHDAATEACIRLRDLYRDLTEGPLHARPAESHVRAMLSELASDS
jgi:hypothetical protein